MIIGIDGNEANVASKVGISEFAYQLLLQFAKQRKKETAFTVYLKNVVRPELPQSSETWQYRIIGPKKLWTQIALPYDLYTHKFRPDVFFTPTHYAPRFSPIPTVIAIMDLSYIHYPHLFKAKDLYQLKLWTRYSAKKAAKILTISLASKNDIIDLYNVEPEKIVVIFPGIKDHSLEKGENMEDIRKKFDLEKNYILFVGTLQPRKNIERLIEAYAKLKKQRENLPTLVIVGKKGWLYEPILEAPQKYGVVEDVRFLEFVDDPELISLYRHAVFFILPSLYEGFGLPILEAMQHGCPVITSNISSMPEAGGDAALYVDPTNTDDIAEKMQLLMHDKKLQEEMREKGYKQIKKFSWEKAAGQTLAVLESIAQNNER